MADSAPASKRAKLIRRTLTGGALALASTLLITLADFLDSPLPVLGLSALIAGAAIVELVRMEADPRAPRAAGLWLALAAAVACVYLGITDQLPRGLAGLGLVAAACVAAGVLGHGATGGRSASRAAGSGLLALWIAPPMVLLAWIYVDYGTSGLVLLIVLSKIGDIAGYYGGSAFGRHHPFKRLSPGKTTEGCLASLVVTALVGAALGAGDMLPATRGGYSPALVGLVIGILINLAAQAGDLLESLAKRRAGVKDSSGLLGASGGFLDVVDSLLLTVPVAIATWGFAFA